MNEPTSELSVCDQPGIRITGLSVTAGGRTLFDRAEATFERNRITLLVGPSGVGKSVLLKMIAGLVDSNEQGLATSGQITVNDQPVTAGGVGVVFQSFALFDEMSPVANVEFARSCGAGHRNPLSTAELLDRLKIPPGTPTSRLSGGQQQRLAIARTLAYNPPVIVYDEPTSGLDPATGQQVAQLIRQTHDRFGETTVIVTHDYMVLLPIADSVYLVDPIQKKLTLIEQADWPSLPQRMEEISALFSSDTLPCRAATWWGQLQRRASRWMEATTDVCTGVLLTLFSILPLWKSPRWGLRYLAHYGRLVFGPTAIIYLILSGIISGFVMTFFTFKFLPYSTYTEPLLIEDLLVGLGFAMYRIVVPVLSCVLIAARCGAAVASDIGGRQFGNQINALKSLGVSPPRYLLTPIVWSFLVGTPLLTYISFVAARLTSLVTFVQMYPQRGPDFWYEHFHRGLLVWGQSTFLGTGWLLAKLLCSGFGIAAIAYHQGGLPKYSSSDVSRCITTTILIATIYVLVVHFIFSFFEYEGVVPGAPKAD